MPDSSSYLLSPLVSLVALALIVLICRWVFSTGSRVVAPRQAMPEDLGLLVPVAEVRTRDDAELLRDLLMDAGVRAGITEQATGMRVLVFQEDLELARQLVNAS